MAVDGQKSRNARKVCNNSSFMRMDYDYCTTYSNFNSSYMFRECCERGKTINCIICRFEATQAKNSAPECIMAIYLSRTFKKVLFHVYTSLSSNLNKNLV